MKVPYLSSFLERHKDELPSSELDKRLLELSALFELSQLLNASLNLKSILDNILLIPMGRMMMSRGITILRKNDALFYLAHAKGIPAPWLGKEWHISRLPEGPIILSQTEYSEDWISELHELKIELLLPLLFRDRHKGFIGFSKKLNGQPFTDDEIQFLSSLGNIAAQAIENAQMFEELNQLNRSLDQKIQELNTLFEIGKELNQIFDEPGILKQLSFSLMGQMLVNQFCIILKEGNDWRLAFRKGRLFPEDKCQTILKQCTNFTELKQPQITHNVPELSSLQSYSIELVVPMDIKGQIGGFIFLGPRMDQQPYAQNQLEFVSTLANIAMIAIENARLIKETIEKERLEEELNIARSIQNKLLPSSFPQLPGFDVHGLNIPSKQVGGDYFDLIPVNENEVIFTIADVSGKGMPAALLMSNLQAGLHTLCNEHYSLAQITSKLNHLIYKNTSIERYITFFIMKLNVQTAGFEYVNAGHNPPYLLHPNGRLDELNEGGLILGFTPNASYEIGQGEFAPGTFLHLFTDGVTECMNEKGEEFSEERLIRFLKTHAPRLTCQNFNEQLVRELKQFAGNAPQSDDITVLSIKRNH
jgi:sigma-B regulation protein RsbU (phosphoserine phosphatase)